MPQICKNKSPSYGAINIFPKFLSEGLWTTTHGTTISFYGNAETPMSLVFIASLKRVIALWGKRTVAQRMSLSKGLLVKLQLITNRLKPSLLLL